MELSNDYVDPDHDNIEIILSVIDNRAIKVFPKRSIRIDDECAVVGACTEKNVDRSMCQLLEAFGIQIPEVVAQFGRLLFRAEVFYSQMYKRPTRRNSYTILFEDAQEHVQKFGVVSYFFMLKSEQPQSSGVYAVIQ